MTLRQLLHWVDLDDVYLLINKKDSEAYPNKAPTLQKTIDAYTGVVGELMKKPKSRKYHMSILVKTTKDWFDQHEYADVCFLNHKYVAPRKGLKPWGGTRGKPIPKGHYNCNDNKHNRTFAMGWTPWSKIIDTPVITEGYSNEQALAEILWELTFYGWTETKVNAQVKEIGSKAKEAVKEIKQGKCITLPSKKKGEYKIVIPDSVSKQIIDIANQTKGCSNSAKLAKIKKCSTCSGNGLWPDGTAPMGPMDAADGMPTIACPECGANRNPYAKS